MGAKYENTIQNELCAIENWALDNNLKLNKSKSKEIIFSNKNLDPILTLPNILIGLIVLKFWELLLIVNFLCHLT